jgi:hypothetical protein
VQQIIIRWFDVGDEEDVSDLPRWPDESIGEAGGHNIPRRLMPE